MYDRVKDSGKREVFSTGAHRDTASGKGRYDLLPTYAIHRLARHFENGAVKYGDENWRKGIPLRRFLDSALRHTMLYLEGHRDEDHAAAAAWNILAMIETEEMIRRGILPESLNNLPSYVAVETKMPEPDLEPVSEAEQEKRIVALGGVPSAELYDDLDECGTTDGTTPLPTPVPVVYRSHNPNAYASWRFHNGKVEVLQDGSTDWKPTDVSADTLERWIGLGEVHVIP